MRRVVGRINVLLTAPLPVAISVVLGWWLKLLWDWWQRPWLRWSWRPLLQG
jgi:hypothetical protein